MTPQEKEILNQYANAKIAESEAKSIIDELSEKVVEIIANNTGGESDDMVIVPQGKYTITTRRKYVYPNDVLAEIEKHKQIIKDIETLSEQIGSGEYVELLSVTFRKQK